VPSGHMRRSVTVCSGLAVPVTFSILAIGYLSATVHAEPVHQSRQSYSRRTQRSYDYRFGANAPFLPSNATVDGGWFIPPGAFPTAAYCGHCHAAAHKQWQESAHRNSFRAPFYKKNVDLLIESKGIVYSRHCEGCHNPIALFSGALTEGSRVDRSFDEDGITCSVCHSISKLKASFGVGSYVMGVPAVIVDEKGNPIPGTVPDEQIMAHPDRHRQAVMRDFYRSPEFCGACHKANLPRSLNGYKWLRAIGTYDEWQTSSRSKRSPLPFYQKDYIACQGCHMPHEAISGKEYGAKSGTLASHRWLGGNTAIPFYYKFDEQLQLTEAFLQRQQLGIDIFALKPSSSLLLAAPLGSTDFAIVPGTKTQAVVVIQNKGLGHSLIPEQRDFFEAWVEFAVTDAAGQEIFHSGYLEPDGTLDKGAHSFTNRLVSKDSRLLVRHEVWERRAVAYDKTVPAGRSIIVRYGFQIPENAEGPLTLVARVNYRHFNQSYLNFVLEPKHGAYPVVEMARDSRTIVIGQNHVGAAQDSNASLWLRWNNYGIALLDEGLYSEAANAFENVVKLKPGYADGMTNVGLAELRMENYSAASEQFNKAIYLEPQNARATFYRALVERAQGRLRAAIVNLQAVEAEFPESADVHRELGISYFLSGSNPSAIVEFESVQACDPDDLLAHYYLSILYRRAGQRDKADREALLYVDEKDDPSAISTALTFLNSDSALYNESLPSHVHSWEGRKSSHLEE
jgi:tetratricopeptide (TPR) repeat protein